MGTEVCYSPKFKLHVLEFELESDPRGRETDHTMCNVQVHSTLLCIYAYAYAHVTHGRAHAARAPCNARRARAAGELSAYRGGQSDVDARDTRAHVERSGQAHVLLVNMSTRDAPAGLVWHCAAVLSCWDPCVTHTEPRSPPRRLHHVASTRFSRPADRRLQPN